VSIFHHTSSLHSVLSPRDILYSIVFLRIPTRTKLPLHSTTRPSHYQIKFIPLSAHILHSSLCVHCLLYTFINIICTFYTDFVISDLTVILRPLLFIIAHQLLRIYVFYLLYFNKCIVNVIKECFVLHILTGIKVKKFKPKNWNNEHDSKVAYDSLYCDVYGKFRLVCV